MESAVRGMGFVLVKDGKVQVPGRDQINLDGNPSVYIRIYQLKIDGKLVNARCKFVYDLRSKYGSCQFRPSIGECLNMISMALVGETPHKTDEEVIW
jgi:hypothetical protein